MRHPAAANPAEDAVMGNGLTHGLGGRGHWLDMLGGDEGIRRDKPQPPIAFIVDAAGKKQTAKTLIDRGRWLWFKPDLIPALMERRGGAVRWYTRETCDLLSPLN